MTFSTITSFFLISEEPVTHSPYIILNYLIDNVFDIYYIYFTLSSCLTGDNLNQFNIICSSN